MYPATSSASFAAWVTEELWAMYPDTFSTSLAAWVTEELWVINVPCYLLCRHPPFPFLPYLPLFHFISLFSLLLSLLSFFLSSSSLFSPYLHFASHLLLALTFTFLHFIYLNSRLIFSLAPLIHSFTTYSTTLPILLLPPLSILPSFHRFLLRLDPSLKSTTGLSNDSVVQLARDGKPFARSWVPVSPWLHCNSWFFFLIISRWLWPG